MVAEPQPTRWAEKHRLIAEAATALFLRKGYLGTSMDDIAAEAAVSKQTVYKHFIDKEQLFAEIVLATVEDIDSLVSVVGEVLERTDDLRNDLSELARRLLTTLMRPEVLRLRRLVITTADLFPEIGRSWYENGLERVLAALAKWFGHLAEHGLLEANDPMLAGHHFAGLLLWIPVNRAMFTGDETSDERQLREYAEAAVEAFLRAYQGPKLAAPASPKT